MRFVLIKIKQGVDSNHNKNDVKIGKNQRIQKGSEIYTLESMTESIPLRCIHPSELAHDFNGTLGKN